MLKKLFKTILSSFLLFFIFNLQTLQKANAQYDSAIQEVLYNITKSAVAQQLNISYLTKTGAGYYAKFGKNNNKKTVFFFKGENDEGDEVWNGGIIGKNEKIVNFKLKNFIYIVSVEKNQVSMDDLPEELANALQKYGVDSDLELLKGLNLYSEISLSQGSKFTKSIKKQLGIKKGTVKLNGVLGSKFIDYITGESSDDSSDYELNMEIGSFTPKSLEVVKGKSLTLSFSSEDGTKSVSGDFDLEFTLPKSMGKKSFTFAGSLVIEDIGSDNPTYIFTSNEEKALKWKKALGMPWLNITNVISEIFISKEKTSIALSAEINSKDVIIEFAESEGEITDFTLTYPGDIKLGSILPFKKIPGIKTFTISNPVINVGAISGQATFKGETVSVLVFKDSEEKWNIALKLENSIAIGKLIGHNKGLLKKIHIPNVDIIVSQNGFEEEVDNLPLAAQNFFEDNKDDIPDGILTIQKGVNLSGQFDLTRLPKDIKMALKKIGIKGKYYITGTVSGMFKGSKPSLDLRVELEESPSTVFSSLFKTKKSKTKSTESFFIKLKNQEVGVGFSTIVVLDSGKKNKDLNFEVDFEIVQSSRGIEVLVAGFMQGDWKNALNIKGMTLQNPYLSIGLTSSGGFNILIDATTIFGKEKVRVSANIVTAAGFVPEALAFVGYIESINFNELTKIASNLSNKALKGNGFKSFQAELREVTFAIMTPGSKLPDSVKEDLKIDNAGIALEAQIFVEKKQLASISGYVSDHGVEFQGDIFPFKIGKVLNVRKGTITIEANVSSWPKFLINGDMKFLGADVDYELAISKDQFIFYIKTDNIAGIYGLEIEARSTHSHSYKDNDFIFMQH